jgi:hypothetical protein
VDCCGIPTKIDWSEAMQLSNRQTVLKRETLELIPKVF